MEALFIQGPQPQLKCHSCRLEAVSVCNYDSQAFKGCGKPFCPQHGLFPECSKLQEIEVFVFKLPTEEEEERERTAASFSVPSKDFRICDLCHLKTLRETSRRDTILLVLACFALTLLGILALSRYRQNTSYLNDQEIDQINTTVGYYFDWFSFRNPDYGETPKVKYLTRFKESNFFQITCACNLFMKEAFMLRSYGTLNENAPCQYESCPPDGSNYLIFSGICTKYSTASKLPKTLQNGPEAHGEKMPCSVGTKFNPRSGSCQVVRCGNSFYSAMLPDFRCSHCPLFTYAIEFSNFCDFLEFREKNYGLQNWYMTPMRKTISCPSSTLRLVDSPHGYYPQVVDEFGYYHCLVQTGDLLPRQCEWYEMTVQYQIGCSSPCQPCSERWDFFHKKCVPGETQCSLLGQSLFSNGECHETYQSLKLPPTIYQCP